MCVQKLEIIAGHQITGYGTCDCKRIFVAVTGVITVTLGMTSDLQGSQKDIEKHWIQSCLEAMRTGWVMRLPAFQKAGRSRCPEKFDDGNIVYSLVKKKPKGKETELVCGNNTGTLNKENALAWLKFTDENEFHTNDRSFWDMLLGRNRGQYMQKSSIIRRWIILSMIMV